MDQGIHPGISWEDYRAIDALNGSTLAHAVGDTGSMLAVRRAIEEPPEPTSAMRVGSGTHSLIELGLDRQLLDYFAVLPQFELDPANVTGSGKPSTSKATTYYRTACEQWRRDLAEGQEEVSQAEYDRIVGNAMSLWSCEPANDLIQSLDHRELTVVGDINGIKCKGRIDGWIDGGHVVSVKTFGQQLGPIAWRRQYDRFKYGFKDAFHLRLLSQHTDVESISTIIVDVNHDVAIVEQAAAVVMGHHATQIENAIDQYRNACRTGEWPGVAPSGFMYFHRWNNE